MTWRGWLADKLIALAERIDDTRAPGENGRYDRLPPVPRRRPLDREPGDRGMTDDFEIVREALTHLLGRDDAGFPSEGFPSCIELYSEFSGTEVLAEARAALAALDRAEAERDRLREALRVYTSGHHRCDRRQCSCGAYTSLLAALSPENEETEG